MAQTRTTDFYRCSRPVQDHFVAATERTAPPAPLLFRSAPRTTAWALLAASGILILVAMLVLVVGWGDVASPLALHGPRMIAVDMLLFSAAAYCFVHAAVILRALEALPYRAGTYVFPASIIDASGPILRVWPVSEMEATERLPLPALAMRMRDGERVVIPAMSASEVERVDAALTSLRPELTRAIAEDNADMLAELDPLHNSRVSSPISSTEGMRRFSPLWKRLDWLIAAAIGITLAQGLVSVRNASSDDRIYRTAVAAGTIPAYKQYLARGGRHTDDVRDVLLARAELYDAQRVGTLAALQEYALTHPSSKIGPEVDAAMRRALLIELDKARAVGTVTALDEFVKSYPVNHLEPELKAARHAVYAQAFATWKKKVHTEAATSAFMERLLTAAEKFGANCEIRFRYKQAKSLEDVDKRLAKHAYYPGSFAQPSHYLNAEAMRPREQHLEQVIVEGFAAAFPPDVLAMHAASPLGATDPTPAGAPVLVVDYSAEWANSTTANEHPRTIFAGIRFDFEPRFVLPEGAPLQLPLKSWRGPETWKIKGGGGMAPEDYHRRIYDMMIDRAFVELQQRLVDAFFR